MSAGGSVRARVSMIVLIVVAAVLAVWWSSRRGEADSVSPASPTASIAADRVILFGPNLTEAAFALGYGDRVVAITDFCVWPPEALALPRVGGMLDPNLERIAALNPRLLVLQGENGDLRSFAAAHSLSVSSVKMDDDIASILAGIAQLDSLFGGGQTGPLVASIRAELDSIAADAPQESPRVLLSLGHDPDSLENLYTVGGGGFLSELLAIAGGVNLYADNARPYFLLSLETLVADPPDIVLELSPGVAATPERRERLRRLWGELASTPPRVELLDFDGLMIPGPRIAETARAIARAIAP